MQCYINILRKYIMCNCTKRFCIQLGNEIPTTISRSYIKW